MTGCASTSFHYHCTYDVFLNFRGKDTRHGFTGNLYHALTQKGVRTFFDDEEIKKGDEITSKLLTAIQESRIAITIFSKNYASSRFCLDELVHIHQCIKQKGRRVWPIFYDVQPCEVRHRTGNYGRALAEHQLKLRADEEKMQIWELALHEVANISGIPLDPGHDYEYQCIERIVKEISGIINRDPLYVAEYPVGIDSRVQKINTLLQLGSKDEVIMVGICGIGGMGKTTTACAVYNLIADNFDGLCFLDDIKEKSRKFDLEKLQERMLSKILGVDTKIDSVREGVQIIKKRFVQKKILLILDNVDKREQLQKLAQCDWFGPGSRIIITTRDRHLLLTHGVNVERIYDVEALDDEESLELLIWNAFKNKQVDPSYKKVVNRVISYVKGLPLALEVIGSHLYGTGIRVWESVLDGYKRSPNEDIQEILKVSYDGLKQDEKEIFLDIACFFQWTELEYVKDMVEHAHGFNPINGIRVLVDKCLIKIEKDDLCSHIKMHDLIKDMGREIVRQESPKEPGKRSRLWSNQDIVDVLEKKTGTNEVNIIISDDLWKSIDVYWDGKAFKNMKSLKILILRNLKFSKGPKYLPNSLKVLKWRGYPSSSLPHGFCPKKLVVLELGGACFSSMETIKKMENLSVLTLEEDKYIKMIPNLFGLSNLKELRVSRCDNLIGVDDSVGYLRNLKIFRVYECPQLHTLPQHIKSPFLEDLSLRVCPRLKNFPEITGEVKLRSLELSSTGIEKLPSSICRLTQLRNLSIENVGEGVIELPGGLFHLPELQEIYIWAENLVMDVRSNIVRPNKIAVFRMPFCNISNENLQLYLNALINVECLDLTACNFTILPTCIKECHSLWRLVLDDCKHLREVEEIPPNIKQLSAIGCILLITKSRNLLLREQLIGTAVLRPPHDEHCLFCIPGESIPEWIDHRWKGASICFWFRNSFPTLCYCAYFQKSWLPEETISRVYINFELVHEGDIFEIYGNHIALSDLKRNFFDDDAMKRVLQEGVWNHAEVYIEGGWDIKENGIYVIKHCNMENIRFTPPEILDRFIPPPKILDSLSGDQDYKTPESPYAEDDDESPYDEYDDESTYDEYDHESPYVKWCDACSYGYSPLTNSLESTSLESTENSSDGEGNSNHSRVEDIYARLNAGSNHLNVVDTVGSTGNYPFFSDFHDNNALPIHQGVNDQTASTSNDFGTNYPRPDSLPFQFQIPARFGVDDIYLLSSKEEGTEYFGSMLNKKRPLIEDANSASSSIPFSCTKRRRIWSINEDENDANTTEINSANAIEAIEQEPSVTGMKEEPHGKSRAKEGSVHVRRRQDEALINDPIIESLENVIKSKGKDIIVYQDDHTEKRGDNMTQS